MYKPKLYLTPDRNGVLNNIRKRTKDFEFVDDPQDSDAIIVWQDQRGPWKDLALLNIKEYHKPYIVIQHGRGCTRDYAPPENFDLLGTKFCCWGQDDYERMTRLGYGDRSVITGCPLLTYVKPKVPHKGKNILFVPVITSHEEPENIATFWELKRLELKHAQEVIMKNRESLITSWNAKIVNPDADIKATVEDEESYSTIPYSDINRNWRLTAKLPRGLLGSAQDIDLYFGSKMITNPTDEKHTEECVELLTQTDVVVCVEEGTFQVLAMAMDIPLIVVKGFELYNYCGVDYSKGERVPIHTKAAEWVELSELDSAIKRELDNPERLSKERKEVVLREFGDVSSNPDDNLVREIKESIFNG